MNTAHGTNTSDVDRRQFLSMVGKGVGLAALYSAGVGALVDDLHAAVRRVEHLTPQQVALDEDFWFEIQRGCAVQRELILRRVHCRRFSVSGNGCQGQLALQANC